MQRAAAALSKVERSTRPASNFIYDLPKTLSMPRNRQTFTVREQFRRPRESKPRDLGYDPRMPSPSSNFFARALLGLFTVGTGTTGMAAPPAAPAAQSSTTAQSPAT